MMLRFRNIDITPEAPVAEWGFEGILSALEHGDIEDWRRIYTACANDESGKIEPCLLEALDALESGEVHPALARVFRKALAERHNAHEAHAGQTTNAANP